MRLLPLIIASLMFGGLSQQAVGDEPRFFEFSYEVLPAELPPGAAVDIYIPLPAENADQLILKQSLQSSIPGSKGLEIRHDNGFYHISRPAGSDAPVSASLRWTVSRNTVRGGSDVALADAERPSRGRRRHRGGTFTLQSNGKCSTVAGRARTGGCPCAGGAPVAQ